MDFQSFESRSFVCQCGTMETKRLPWLAEDELQCHHRYITVSGGSKGREKIHVMMRRAVRVALVSFSLRQRH